MFPPLHRPHTSERSTPLPLYPMSRPPAFPAGIRLLLCFGAAALFAAALFRLGRSAETIEPNSLTTLNKSNAQATLESPPQSTSTNAFARNSAFASLAKKLRSQPPSDPALMQALEQLAQDPVQAVSLARRLMAEFTNQSTDIGTIIIGALLRAAAFSPALELAQNGPEASRAGWITLVLINWTQNRPEDAELITEQLRENSVTAETFSLVTKSWATSAPTQLARYALTLPPGEYRSIAIGSVLDPWIQQDPAGASSFLAQTTNPAEHDQVLSRLATHTDNAFRPTGQALAWAEAIGNDALRKEALAHVVREWFGQDPAAATRYIEASPAFSQTQRHQLIASFTPPVDPP